VPREPTKMAEIKGAASRLFATREGKILLQYLTTKYYDAPLKDATIHREAGRRDVMAHIMKLIED